MQKMFYTTKPEDHVKSMKKMAKMLQAYSPPKYPRDEDISWLKSRDIIVDGIPMVVHYSESDHGDLKPAVLTIGCKNVPFIPLAVICKVARMFLGSENLTLFEYTKDGSKIYSWMALYNKDTPVINHHTDRAEKESYNGFDFFRIDMNNEEEAIPDFDG